LLLEQVALEQMKGEATRGLPRESGGILIGRFERDIVVVTQAGGPGRQASRGNADFRRDGEHAQRVLDSAVAASGGDVDYVGEWHSHPSDVPASPKDERSMGHISADPDYKRSQPILVVVRRAGTDWTIDASQFVGQKLRAVPVAITSAPPSDGLRDARSSQPSTAEDEEMHERPRTGRTRGVT